MKTAGRSEATPKIARFNKLKDESEARGRISRTWRAFVSRFEIVYLKPSFGNGVLSRLGLSVR